MVMEQLSLKYLQGKYGNVQQTTGNIGLGEVLGLDLGFGTTGIVEFTGFDVTDERERINKKRERSKVDSGENQHLKRMRREGVNKQRGMRSSRARASSKANVGENSSEERYGNKL